MSSQPIQPANRSTIDLSTRYKPPGKAGRNLDPNSHDVCFESMSKNVAANHHYHNLELRINIPAGIPSMDVLQLINRTKRTQELYLPTKVSSKKEDKEESSLRENVLCIIRRLLIVPPLQFDPSENYFDEAGVSSKNLIKITPEAFKIYEQISISFNSSCSLLNFCISTKDLNLAMQYHIVNLNQNDMEIIREMAIKEFSVLIKHKHGNYLIQRIVQRDPQFSSLVAKVCTHNFRDFASNEYSSRVMQLLVRERQDFRSFVLNLFANDIRYGCSRLTVAFQLLIAIRTSVNPTEYLFVHHSLVQDHTLYESPLFKRILISYMQFADLEMVRATWIELRKFQRLETFFERKFNSLLILMVLRRGCEEALHDIFWHVRNRFCTLMKRGHFRLVMEKLLQPKYIARRALLNDCLQQITKDTLNRLARQNLEHLYFYLHLTTSSFLESESTALEEFLNSKLEFLPEKIKILLATYQLKPINKLTI